MVSLLINEGFSEVMFIVLQNATSYGLSLSSILVTVIMFGFFVPVVSIAGPTREALNKNLRGSLDASRRDGANEGVSVTVKKL